jgi:predicted membrane protein
MKREDIKLFLELAIGILLIVLAIRFFIAILPLIIVLLIGLLIYDSYQRQKKNPVTKKKDNTVKEAEIVKEKNID